MTERRAFLRGLAALPLATVPAAKSDQIQPDPIVRLFNEKQALVAYIDSPIGTDEEHDTAYDRGMQVDLEAIALRAKTLAEACAAAEWVLIEFETYHGSRDGCEGDRLVIALLEGTISALRTHIGMRKGGAV